MRLIDSTKLIDALPIVAEDKKISLIGAVADMVMLISEQPVIEAEPVRHGRWECVIEIVSGVSAGQCSECGRCDFVKNYCPNCGAKMRGESDE